MDFEVQNDSYDSSQRRTGDDSDSHRTAVRASKTMVTVKSGHLAAGVERAGAANILIAIQHRRAEGRYERLPRRAAAQGRRSLD